MGFPGGTIDVPGTFHPDLAAIVGGAALDPYGHGERLVAVLRDGLPVARGHLATNAWVFDAEARRVLLVRHRTLGWVNPGGHLEDGEEPAAGAARELAEETGLALDAVDERPGLVRVGLFPARGDDPAHWHWNLHYLFRGDPEAPLTPEDGSPVAWFPVDALPEPRVGDLDDLLALIGPLLSRQLKNPGGS
jgi:ADP-ribose pyrophosphatase YjhB (NUDIX family)